MSDSLAQITELLYRDFHDRVTLSEIIELVRRCHDELDAAPADVLPELVERLARQRLAGPPAEPPASDAPRNGPEQ